MALSAAFESDGSAYGLGVDGLNSILLARFGDELEELFEETDFNEGPQIPGTILDAEKEMFDRIWCHRSLQSEFRYEREGKQEKLEHLRAIAGAGRQRVEQTYTEPGKLGQYSDFELGMLSGKLSAIRWVRGSDWDFLDT